MRDHNCEAMSLLSDLQNLASTKIENTDLKIAFLSVEQILHSNRSFEMFKNVNFKSDQINAFPDPGHFKYLHEYSTVSWCGLLKY